MSVAVVTGATSFLGAELTRQLLAQGDTVVAVVRPNSSNANALTATPGLRLVELDLSHLDRLPAHAPAADAFYHLGWDGGAPASRHHEDVQQRNVLFAEQAARAAVAMGCRAFVFTGSQAEYGPQDGPLAEGAALVPTTAYGRAKTQAGQRAAELCAGAGLAFAHGRVLSVYGPGDHPWTLITQCVEGFLKGQNVALSAATQPWNYLYVRDAAAALRALCARQGVYNIAGLDTRLLRQFVQDIHRLCGSRGQPLYASREPGAPPPYGIQPVADKLLATGWRPQVPFEQGIRLILEERV